VILELLVFGGAGYAIRNYRNQQLHSSLLQNNEAILQHDDEEEKGKQLKIIEARELRTDMVISTASLCLSIMGNLVYAPLRILSIPGWIYVSLPAIMQAIEQLRARKVDVSTIFTITFIGCMSAGYYATGNLAAFFYVLSKKLIDKLKDDSHKSLVDVFSQHPNDVWLVVDGSEISIPFEELKEGDVVVVTAGETIPADGTIIGGNASVDQHLLTGEAQPVEKTVDDGVFAATVVISGKVYIKVEKAGQASTAAQIGQILNQTTHFKTEGERYAENITQKSIIPTLIVGGASLPLLGPMAAVSMINAHFGYRMAITSSIVSLSYLQLVARKGILIKSGEVLDLLPKVDTLVFDKTGTLTMMQPTLGTIHVAAGFSEDDILAYAAAAEYKQTHPIAQAILQQAKLRGLTPSESTACAYQVGFGLHVHVDNKVVHLGSKRFMEHEQLTISEDFHRIATEAEAQGFSLIMLAVDNVVVGAIELRATLRPEAKNVIYSLKKEALIKTTYIISGDSEAPTRELANELGIDHYYAGVLPQEKATIIERLQAEGRTVCYIGDGINDAIALKKAHISVSMRGASTIATDTAQVVLMNENLNQLYYLLAVGHQFNKSMQSSCNTILFPSIAAAGCVMFLGMNLAGTVILKQLALTAGIAKATHPILQHHAQASRLKHQTET